MEQWIDNIRRQAQDYERKAPDGLLDDIKQAMDAQPRAPRTSMRIIWGRRIAVAVAAAIAVLVVWNITGMDNSSSPDSATAKGGIAQTNVQATGNSLSPQIPTKDESVTAGIRSWIQQIANNVKGEALAYAPQGETVAIQEPATEPVIENVARQTTPTTPPDDRRADSPTNDTGHNRDWWASSSRQPTYIRRDTRHTDISIAYSGMSGTNSYGSMALSANDSKTYNDAGGLTMAATDMTTHAHHDMPVKLGLNIRYNINNRWSIQAGATYSRLTSDITRSNNFEEYRSHQRLHYAGATLSASYSLWRTKNVNVYLTAGGEAAKLVSGTASVSHSLNGQKEQNYDENIHEHRLQYSVTGAAGIEYNPVNSISLFAEPGVAHYFDNHSSVVNIYKDKPTQFNLNVGLRINIGK